MCVVLDFLIFVGVFFSPGLGEMQGKVSSSNSHLILSFCVSNLLWINQPFPHTTCPTSSQVWTLADFVSIGRPTNKRLKAVDTIGNYSK